MDAEVALVTEEDDLVARFNNMPTTPTRFADYRIDTGLAVD